MVAHQRQLLPRKPRGHQQTPSQTVYVPRNILLNATDNALRKHLFHNIPHLPRRITVEANPLYRSDSVFFAPFPSADDAPTAAVPTEFLTVDPKSASDIVHSCHDFTLAFVGMHVPPFDIALTSRPRNDLLLYSVCEAQPQATISVDQLSAAGLTRRKSALRRCTPAAAEPTTAPPMQVPGMPRGIDEPTIHYDPFADGKAAGTKANTFVPIPDSKSVFHCHRAHSRAAYSATGRVDVRFCLMEIDHVAPGTAAVVQNVEKLNGALGQTLPLVPYASVITAAVDTAVTLGKRGLRRYAKPDHVMTTDFSFKLYGPRREFDADQRVGWDVDIESSRSEQEYSPGHDSTEQQPTFAGKYLRYGYYFFLSDKVDARLYAQTGTSGQNVPLLMRRTGLLAKKLERGERHLFPLSGVSYVVIKVSPGCDGASETASPAQRAEHRERLEHILSMGTALGELAAIHRRSDKNGHPKHKRYVKW